MSDFIFWVSPETLKRYQELTEPLDKLEGKMTPEELNDFVNKYMDPANSKDPYYFQMQQIRMQAKQMASSPTPSWMNQLEAIFSIDGKPVAVITDKKNRKPSCLKCGIELCQELDAYYGKSAYSKEHCSPCRRKYKYD